ncbi:hypothetical protein PILCRDRAFT_825030 [Piloderma croceum F 1598]|uniref:Uncharacterized protein n=1 Tax=Piloderma croceum (strain F 1598) TaxID=765440 RepID=A0A0C3BKC8_PILCF|nr:hypothetical protein PILCRDRAFT_825030 [Piloderma croceum F 1598]
MFERASTTPLHLNTKYGDLSPMVAKGPLEPRVHNLPRRRKTSDQTVRKISETTVKDACAPRRTASSESRCTVEPDESCLQELVPNLFVAFVDEEGYNQVQGMSGEPFTHFVRISSVFRKNISQNVMEHTVDDNGAQVLHLIVPRDAGDDGQTILMPPQLLTARDFLSQAMPRHYHLLPVPAEYPAVRILITTSNKRAADAISVAACYLAFESGETTHTVLECINEEEDILGTWRGIVSRDGIDVIEHITQS